MDAQGRCIQIAIGIHGKIVELFFFQNCQVTFEWNFLLERAIGFKRLYSILFTNVNRTVRSHGHIRTVLSKLKLAWGRAFLTEFEQKVARAVELLHPKVIGVTYIDGAVGANGYAPSTEFAIELSLPRSLDTDLTPSDLRTDLEFWAPIAHPPPPGPDKLAPRIELTNPSVLLLHYI